MLNRCSRQHKGAMEAKLSQSLDDIVAASRRASGGGTKRRHQTRTPIAKASRGDTISSRLGGKTGGRPAAAKQAWRKHVQRKRDAATGETVVRFYETDVVRIGTDDIVLSSGGYSNDVTRHCINDALSNYVFSVKQSLSGDWFVSDGRTRLVRFTDGIVLSGAARELKEREQRGHWRG